MEGEMMKDHSVLVRWYDSYETATQNERSMAERDRDYYDGKQLTAEELEILKKRGQPALIFNRIAPKLDYVLGTEMKLRSDPKAFPRTPHEEGAAEVATDAIRYVCDDNAWDQERSEVYSSILIEGVGAVKVHVEYEGEEPRIRVRSVPWDRLFWDPRARWHDFRDAKYFGEVIWMDLEDALEVPEWEGAHDVLRQAVSDEQASNQTHADRPTTGVWADATVNRERVKIVYMCYKVGSTWYAATFTKSGFIEEPRVSPYVDEHGIPEPELILQAAKQNRDNEHYGIVRPLISPQDEVNKRRSKSLHALNVRQIIAEAGAVKNKQEAKQEAAKPDGYLEVAPGARFEINTNSELAQGHIALLQDAKSELDAQGANSALTGKDPREQSGRAIMARQQSGIIELEILFDRLRWLSLRTYRAVWHRIRQFWRHEKWVRVTDSEEHMKWVPMNHPVTLGEMLEANGISPEQYMMEQTGGMYVDPMTMQQMMSQVAEIQNNVAELDVDIVLDESVDTTVLQQEQWEQLMQLAGQGFPIPPDVLIQASSLRNKQQIIDAIKGIPASPEEQAMQQQQQAEQQAMAQQAVQLEMQEKSAKVGKTMAETEQIQVRTRVDVDKAARESANEQMERMGYAMSGGAMGP